MIDVWSSPIGPDPVISKACYLISLWIAGDLPVLLYGYRFSSIPPTSAHLMSGTYGQAATQSEACHRFLRTPHSRRYYIAPFESNGTCATCYFAESSLLITRWSEYMLGFPGILNNTKICHGSLKLIQIS